jgi:hypothetical protein
MWSFLSCTPFAFFLMLVVTSNCFAVSNTDEQLEFFEHRIRPVLVEHCYSCHNAAKSADGSLVLDHRDGMMKGGDGGQIIIPGDPKSSRLISILRHEIPGMKMPQGGAKLDPSVIADIEKWIAMGAPDPRDHPPDLKEIEQATSWETIVRKRKQWWSLQPIQNAAPSVLPENDWSSHPVDRFVLGKLLSNQLRPNDRAEARSLVRRLYFVLIGLPPTAEESDRWASVVAEPNGFLELVDHLLSSVHFGERWARHWMDWIRYADSHGSEGDPPIENGWLYRDYLIRALNADVSFDQLLREHVAGDLLKQPRINTELGINESVIGTAHWRMVFHGFSPTDALDEKTRFIDDQVNVFSKAFLGLTVSCARCHDHKFDAISQNDYYAIAGILGSCRPGRSAIELPEKIDRNRGELTLLKSKIKQGISNEWLSSLPALKARLLSQNDLWKKADSSEFALYGWALLQKELAEGRDVADAWNKILRTWKQEQEHRDAEANRETLQRWRMGDAKDFANWHRTGLGISEESPALAGEFAIASKGNTALVGLYPSGIYSHRWSAKHPARITSGDFRIDGKYDLWLRVLGDGDATARFVVHDYPRRGVVFPTTDLKPQWQWVKIDLSYWEGDKIHLELTTALDSPVLVKNVARSWFGLREAFIVPQGDKPPQGAAETLDKWIEFLKDKPPKSVEDAAAGYIATLENAIHAWQENALNDSQAILLDACLRQGILSNDINELADTGELLREYRRLEEEIPVATRVPTLEETLGRTQALYIRGDHKNQGADVPRGFLDIINSNPYSTKQSGRIELADDLLRQDNPLTRRVIVNRLWHHLFGRGIVATPDNFGKLGDVPTHPELLDHLASEFYSQGGSIKQMIRYLVASKTWQMDSRPSAESQKTDPENRFWSHARVRRLEAEAIRDSLFAVSGSLDPRLFGEPVKGNSPRRSVYIRAQRNALDPFLRAFDFPEPFSSVGARDVTNVPAQSLTLMNDPQVASLATAWAKNVLADGTISNRERIQRMFLGSIGRPATTDELELSLGYLKSIAEKQEAFGAEVSTLQQKMEKLRLAIEEVLEPIRTKILGESESQSDAAKPSSLKPTAEWEFSDAGENFSWKGKLELHPGAKLGKDGLVVKKLGYASTPPLTQTIKAKTLEAWVQLPQLDQRGGGVITIQSLDGSVFDSIVFGEESPYQWLAGSDHHQRTQSFQGPPETEASHRLVHFAIVYHEDGQVVGYRDGELYGKPYQSNGPYEFKKSETVVSFGVRHLPAAKNKMLSGTIARARLYDRALNAEEIQISARTKSTIVSDKRLMDSLSDTQRVKIESDRLELARLEKEWNDLNPFAESTGDVPLWSDFARAIFTLKEFLFVK